MTTCLKRPSVPARCVLSAVTHGHASTVAYTGSIGWTVSGGQRSSHQCGTPKDAPDRCWCICTATQEQQKLQMHLIRFPRAQQAQDAKSRDPGRRRPLARLRRRVRDGRRHALGRSARLHAPQGEGMETTADSRDRGVLRSLTGRKAGHEPRATGRLRWSKAQIRTFSGG